VMPVNGAMFLGALGLVVAGTAAAIDGRVPVDLAKQGASAIGNAAADDPERATFADFGADFPVRIDGQGPDPPQAGRREFAHRLQKIPRYAGRCRQSRHVSFYRSIGSGCSNSLGTEN